MLEEIDSVGELDAWERQTGLLVADDDSDDEGGEGRGRGDDGRGRSSRGRGSRD